MTSGSPENGRLDQCPNVLFLSKRSKPSPSPSPFRSDRQLRESVQRMFPDMLWGQAFQAHADGLTAEDTVLSAMAIQFDALSSNAPEKLPPPSVEVLVQTIQQYCLPHDGLLGMMPPVVLGCILRHADAQACRSIAADIQAHVDRDSGTTLTIGIAEFPTLDYARGQIVENALKALDHAKFLSPGALVVLDDVTLNISGDRLYDEGRLEEAVDEFNKALALNSANPNVHNSLGVCHAVMENMDLAMEEFEAAMGLDNREAFAFYNAGLAHKMRGNLQQALDYLLTAHRLDPELFEAVLQIGCIYNEMAQPEQAEAVLNKAVELNPESAGAYTQLGECRAALNRPQEAIEAFKTAIKRNANDATALSGLGWLYFQQGENFEIAKLFCERSIDIDPQNGRYHFRLGRIYLAEKRYRDALSRFETARHLGYDTEGDIDEVKTKIFEKTDKNEGYRPLDTGRQHCG